MSVHFSSSEYRVVSFDGKRLPHIRVVLFDTWRPDPSLETESFGEMFLASRDISFVCVKAASNDWYLGDVDPALRVARAICDNRIAIGYGASMGAYAAINYSTALGLRRCVCVAPQFSVDPRIAPFETRWRDETEGLNFARDRCREAADIQCDILFDPFEIEDRMHVDLIAKTRPISRVVIPFAGHDVADFLLKVGVLKSAALELIEYGYREHSPLRGEIRAGRQKVATYWRQMSKAKFARGHIDCALSAALMADESLGGADIESQVQILHMLNAAGRGAEAMERGERLAADPRRSPEEAARVRAILEDWIGEAQ